VGRSTDVTTDVVRRIILESGNRYRMKRFNDPEGHYERLGVDPTASMMDIKIAFRRRAMELHPDRNASADTTEEFQQLTESYNLLIDSAARMRYDTNGHSAGLGSPPSDREERLRLIVCSMCEEVAAHPRFIIFHEVRSYLLVSKRATVQGIFCPECAQAAGLRATLITWLRGWWALPLGPVYSLLAIARNLLGGAKPNEVNARMLLYQAWAFATAGNTLAARAVALEALEFASRIPLIPRSAGDEEAPDGGVNSERALLETAIEEFFNAVGSNIPVVDSGNPWQLYRRGFFLQALIIFGAIGMIAAAGVWMVAPARHHPQIADQPISATTPDASTTSQEATPGYVRSEVADNGAAWPTSSGYVRGYPIELVEGNSSITIVNLLNDSDVFVKMFSLDSTPPKPVRTVFVRASDQFTVRTVAAGRYELRYRDLDSGALYRTDPFSIDTEGAKHNALPITLDDPNELSTHTHPISDQDFYEPVFTP